MERILNYLNLEILLPVKEYKSECEMRIEFTSDCLLAIGRLAKSILEQDYSSYVYWNRKLLSEVVSSLCREGSVSADEVIDSIEKERDKIILKFGDMPQNTSPYQWLAVLAEEAGEAEEALTGKEWTEEMVQVGAVLVSMMEDFVTGTEHGYLGGDTEKFKQLCVG